MKVLVTGGGGFVGGAVVDQALARGWQVRSVARGDYPQLALKGVETMRGDLADDETAMAAVDGCDGVFHVAAKAGVSGSAADYERSNVTATIKLVEACKARGVGRLVYTSTPSVVHGGGDVEGVDESLPYADHFTAPYPETKARAERYVLSQADDNIGTVAIRPHLVWGPGDTQLIPRLIERARSGRARLVGDGSNVIDTTFVENAAAAHLAAFDRLDPRAAISGRSYFIAQGEPRPIRLVINDLLNAVGVPPVTKSVPYPVAYAAGTMAEWFYRRFRPDEEPPITRFLAEQLSTAHWYDLTAARTDLEYVPQVSFEEGLTKLATAYSAG